MPTRVVGAATGAVQCALELGESVGATGGGYLIDALRYGGSDDPYGWTLRTSYMVSAVSIVFALLAAPPFEQGRRALAELVEKGDVGGAVESTKPVA